jgi:hypothetical protein
MTKSKRAKKSAERRALRRAANKKRTRAAITPRAGEQPARQTLGARREVEPARLIRGTADIVGEFMIALAAVFNDLKDVAAFETLLLPTLPGPTDYSVDAGEWRGRHLMINRFIAGIIHELMELIVQKQRVLNEIEFQRVLGRIQAPAKADWEALVQVANRQGTDGDAMRRTLAYVRNNVSFHYTALSEIGRAWQRVFVEGPRTEANRTAVYSLGDNMERTRFHFADAAFEGAMFRAGEQFLGPASTDAERVDARIIETAGRVNTALRFMLEEFIAQRSAPGVR